MPSLLESTGDLLTLYLHHAGLSETPRAYHLWSALAMMAAAVADRVWIEKFRGITDEAPRKLTPNLYVMLLGPSGIGKSTAIDCMLKFLKGTAVQVYSGEVTSSHLLHAMGEPAERPDGEIVLENSKVFLVLDELAMSVGEGPEARAFIRHLTGLYSGSAYPFTKGTVTRGTVTIKDHNVNSLMGTTKEWLIECVSASAIRGGFGGRVVCVSADYPTKRYTRPQYPDDYNAVTAYLQQQVHALTQLSGVMALTPQAREIEEHWYQTRPQPADDDMLPAWRREHDLMLKLGMLHALSRTHRLDAVDAPDVVRAQQLVNFSRGGLEQLIGYVGTSNDTRNLRRVADVIMGRKEIYRGDLVRKTSMWGIHSKELDDIIKTLHERHDIEFARIPPSPRGGRPTIVYKWIDPVVTEGVDGEEATPDDDPGHSIDFGAADGAADEDDE
jgi:energy-coupling factor transporter ATP-binding protein EcfA2